MTKLQGAHVLVVGASEGIGRCVAIQAHRNGARVSLIARREQRLSEVAKTLADTTTVASSVAYQAGDACDPTVLAAAVERLVDVSGPVDVAICCVGGAAPGYFCDITVAEFHSQMDLNFFAAVNVTKTVLPVMVERGAGHLVFTASTAALLGVFGYTSYAAAKWALRGFAETLRYESEPCGVKVSVVYPPDTYTPGFEAENLRKPPETIAVSGSIRPRQPDAVAKAVIRGIERDRHAITVDGQTRVLTRFAGLVDPLVRSVMRRQIRAVTGDKEKEVNEHAQGT